MYVYIECLVTKCIVLSSLSLFVFSPGVWRTPVSSVAGPGELCGSAEAVVCPVHGGAVYCNLRHGHQGEQIVRKRGHACARAHTHSCTFCHGMYVCVFAHSGQCSSQMFCRSSLFIK